MQHKSPRPTRYGHVLRRLHDGKTTAINRRVAEGLAAAQLVEILDAGSTASTVRVALTDAGRKVALQAKKGVNVFPQLGIRRP